jgi:membrane protease YdiL (CAAX protease family)
MEEDPRQEPEEDQPGRDVIIILAVFFEAGLAPASLLLGWLLGHPPLERFVWSLQDALWGTVAAVPLIALFVAMLTWPVGPLVRFKQFCEEEFEPLFHQSYYSELALVALSAGVGEEMLFRGVIQASFIQGMGVPWGLALASALFGLLHPISILYIVIASFLGFYLGAIWIINGNLLTVMVAHAVYDFAALGYIVRVRHWDDESDSK